MPRRRQTTFGRDAADFREAGRLVECASGLLVVFVFFDGGASFPFWRRMRGRSKFPLPPAAAAAAEKQQQQQQQRNIWPPRCSAIIFKRFPAQLQRGAPLAQLRLRSLTELVRARTLGKLGGACSLRESIGRARARSRSRSRSDCSEGPTWPAATAAGQQFAFQIFPPFIARWPGRRQGSSGQN